jgi:hypothetical protein
MSEVKHTPGPWKVSHWYSTVGQTCGVSNGILGVAAVYGTGRTEAESNARLVAAAPELLRAAEKHLAALEEEAEANMALDNAEANFSDARPEIRRAGIAMVAASTAAKELRAAIAKALGEHS